MVPKAIAERLCIDRAIVYLHLAHIRKSVGAHSSIEMLHILLDEPETSRNPLKLTPRGAEVFQLILKGMSDKKIGETLGMSYSGVRRHKEKMLLANDCNDMLELVAKYYEPCVKTEEDEPLGA